MALSSRCLRYLALVATVLFMVLGVTAAVLQCVFTLPMFSLLSVPPYLHVPLMVPLVPTLLAVPVGFFGLGAARNERMFKLLGVTCLQVLLSLALAVLAGWQVTLSFGARLEVDLRALMVFSLLEPKWHVVYHELRCCGVSGPASFEGSIPTACCVRDEVAASSGPCSTLYSTGCLAPASEQIRGVLRSAGAVNGGAAVLMFLCAVLSAVFVDSLKRAAQKRKELRLNHEDTPLRSPVVNQKF